jgi:hypothetical protein
VDALQVAVPVYVPVVVLIAADASRMLPTSASSVTVPTLDPDSACDVHVRALFVVTKLNAATTSSRLAVGDSVPVVYDVVAAKLLEPLSSDTGLTGHPFGLAH